MRTLFWTCVLALFFIPCVSAQDLAQLRKTIDDNIPALGAPEDFGRKVPSQEMLSACKAIVEAVTQMDALPNLDDQDRRWVLQREAFARIPLAYVDTPAHYARLSVLSDELEQMGLKKVAKLTEEHVLRIGAALTIQAGNNAMNINAQALAERMVMFARQYPGAESSSMIDQFLRGVRLMKSQHNRDRRLAMIAPVFQEYYREIHHTPRANALEADIRRATLPGNPMSLWGVDIDGNVFNPAMLRNKVVLLQFWGTWCAPCRAEIPDLIALHEKYKSFGFEIIGVNTGENGDDERTVKRFVDTTLFSGKRIPWRILHEGLGERQNNRTMTKYYGIDELPVLILIGRDGKVLNLHPLPSTLDAIVAEATDPTTAIKATFTEEEKKLYEENQRKRQEEQQEEIDRQIKGALSSPR